MVVRGSNELSGVRRTEDFSRQVVMNPLSKPDGSGKAPFDEASLWDRVNEDSELLGDLLQIFTQEYPVMLQKLQAALEEKSMVEIARFSHKLKGSALQFSAHPAANTAGRLEKMAQAGALEGADVLFAQLQQEIAELADALRCMVRNRTTQP
jgi:HPt (histidine-containing phosphotransfer) domain-containing protein